MDIDLSKSSVNTSVEIKGETPFFFRMEEGVLDKFEQHISELLASSHDYWAGKEVFQSLVLGNKWPSDYSEGPKWGFAPHPYFYLKKIKRGK